jgi:hypothetical protein
MDWEAFRYRLALTSTPPLAALEFQQRRNFSTEEKIRGGASGCQRNPEAPESQRSGISGQTAVTPGIGLEKQTRQPFLPSLLEFTKKQEAPRA